MKAKSLSFRLFLSSTLVMICFFVIVAFVLEQGFRESSERALKEQLLVQVYALLSAVDFTPAGVFIIPEKLPEPRFSNAGSGLYANVWLSKHQLIWRSRSAIDVILPAPPSMNPGSTVFQLEDSGVYVLDYRVIWETEAGLEKDLIFTIAEDANFVSSQVSVFRKVLRTWLAGACFALIAFQFIILRWSLKPLRTIVQDMSEIEQGRKSSFEGVYPTELQGLVDNLNGFISSERRQLERYRNTLADLAHSLKTPLAILRGGLETSKLPIDMDNTLQAEVSRMDDIVEYHLQRAAAKGRRESLVTIDPIAIIKKISSSLRKVYSDKQVEFNFNVGNADRLNCETGDFYEIAGNLIDNAFKCCSHKVKVSLLSGSDSRFSIAMVIEDDGLGIVPEQLGFILQRGIRADVHSNGHGIGLAIVQELIDLLGGTLTGEKSELLGGMKWIVLLP